MPPVTACRPPHNAIAVAACSFQRW